MSSPISPSLRAAQAVHLGFVSVLRYLINHRYVSPHMIDGQGRTLPFLAIMYNKPLILKFLLTVGMWGESRRNFMTRWRSLYGLGFVGLLWNDTFNQMFPLLPVPSCPFLPSRHSSLRSACQTWIWPRAPETRLSTRPPISRVWISSIVCWNSRRRTPTWSTRCAMGPLHFTLPLCTVRVDLLFVFLLLLLFVFLVVVVLLPLLFLSSLSILFFFFFYLLLL